MLFLHNFQQAFTWSLKIASATKYALSVLTKPIVGSILEVLEFTLPLWNLCAETIVHLSSFIMIAMVTSCSAIISTVQMIMWAFWLVFSILLNIDQVNIKFIISNWICVQITWAYIRNYHLGVTLERSSVSDFLCNPLTGRQQEEMDEHGAALGGQPRQQHRFEAKSSVLLIIMLHEPDLGGLLCGSTPV